MDVRLLERQLKALGSKQRLRILQELKRRRNLSVSDLAHTLHLSVQATSVHLQKLAALEIIKPRRRAQSVLYRLSLPQSPLLKHVLALL